MRNKENQTRNQILLNIYAKKFESERCLKSIFFIWHLSNFFFYELLSVVMSTCILHIKAISFSTRADIDKHLRI